jgi:hypothetical protein
MDDFGGALEYDDGQSAADMPPVAPAQVFRKKGVNIYTFMLILSLIFLIAGAAILYANVANYKL